MEQQKTSRISKLKVALATVAIGALLVVPVGAENEVTQEITAGDRSASIEAATLEALPYSHAEQVNSGALTLTANDSSGTDAGWNVTVLASDFEGDGSDSIVASNFEITSADTPTTDEGQAIDTEGGPRAGSGGTLEEARMVLDAEAGYGKGTYEQALDVELTIPGQTLADTYTSTLTVSISSGPGN